MKYTFALIWAIAFIIASVGFRITKTDPKLFWPLIIIGLIGGVTISQIDVLKRFKAPGGWEVETAREQIAEETEKGIESIQNEIAVQREAISSLIDKANDTRKDLLRVAEVAGPPRLNLESKEIKQVEGEYEVRLEFKPSKNGPFGYISFGVEINQISNATINKLNPYNMQVYGSPGKISDDGKSATLWYVPIGALWQKIMIRLSAPCHITITSNHMQGNVVLQVE